MTQFKVEDRVRIGVSENDAPEELDGAVGFINSCDNQPHSIGVYFEAIDETWYYEADELTLEPITPKFSVGDLVRIKKGHRLESDLGSTRGVVVDTQKFDEGEWGPEFNARVVFTNGGLRGEKYWLAFASLKADK